MSLIRYVKFSFSLQGENIKSSGFTYYYYFLFKGCSRRIACKIYKKAWIPSKMIFNYSNNKHIKHKTNSIENMNAR